jgi:hypothetical protein
MSEVTDAEKAEVVAAIRTGNAIVCYAKCWPCNFGDCPGGWHTWADSDDVEHAAKTGRPDPSTQRCGCPCVDEPERDVPEPPALEAVSLNADPCPVCGEVSACDYDSDGRPLIHAITEDDDA